MVSADTVERGVYVAGSKDKVDVDSRSFMRLMRAQRKL